MKKIKMKKKGFTLMETMVTFVILGILASVAIPAYQNVMRDTRIKDAETNLLLLFTAEKIYRNEIGNYYAGANAGLLNTNLNTGIIAGSTGYSCTVLACTADGGSFTREVDITLAAPVVYE